MSSTMCSRCPLQQAICRGALVSALEASTEVEPLNADGRFARTPLKSLVLPYPREVQSGCDRTLPSRSCRGLFHPSPTQTHALIVLTISENGYGKRWLYGADQEARRGDGLPQ